MEKAWDIKALAERLKSRGLDLTEKAAGIAAEEILGWTKESIELSETKIDDLALPFLPAVESKVKDLVDQINGKKDNA